MVTRLFRVVAMIAGLSFLAAVATQRALLFVRPWFAPALLAAGALLLAAALARGRPELRRPAALVLVLPVVVGLSLTPSVVGRIQLGSGDERALEARLGEGPNPLLDGREGRVSLLDIVVAEGRVGGVALAGRRVVVEAQVSGPGRIRRSVMVCCAADARAIGIRVSGTDLPEDDVWVRVDGVLTTDDDELLLEARRVRRIPVPNQPFL